MFGSLDQLGSVLCEIRDLLRSLAVAQTGQVFAPGAAPAAGRYTLQTRNLVIDHAGWPTVQLAPQNPVRILLAVGCLGPGDIFVSGDQGQPNGFPVFAGMAMALGPLTEALYGTASAANTQVVVAEVVRLA